jgi:hypothetical protein
VIAVPIRSTDEDWATDTAHDGVLARGFEINRSGWRNIFLAITDAVLEQPQHYDGIHAEYLGTMRQGERWAICWRGRWFDVVYNPDRAVIDRVVDHRGPAPEPAGSPVPVAPLRLGPAGAEAVPV